MTSKSDYATGLFAARHNRVGHVIRGTVRRRIAYDQPAAVEEAPMAVIIRNVTQEQYDAVRAACNWLEEAPAGGLAHLTWWEDDDCYNLDAWDSEQAMGAFSEQRLAPAMAQAGV